jgi:adenylosuccinate synthase
VNGLSAVVLTRLDVLDTFETIGICTAYEIDGERVTDFPASVGTLQRAKPIFEPFPGWNCSTKDVRSWTDLPLAAQAYVKKIEELMEVPIGLVSVGPEREQFLSLDSIF